MPLDKPRRTWNRKTGEDCFCGRPVWGRGLCATHLRRERLNVPINAPVENKGHFKWDSPRARDVKPAGAHRRCRKQWGSASQYPCVQCGDLAKDWAYDGTDPTQLYGPYHTGNWAMYSAYPEFYMPMCGVCHNALDGGKRSDELREYRLWKQKYGISLSDIPEQLLRELANA